MARRTGKMRLGSSLRTKRLPKETCSVECAKNNHGSCDQATWKCMCDCHPPLPIPAPEPDREMPRRMVEQWRERGGA